MTFYYTLSLFHQTFKTNKCFTCKKSRVLLKFATIILVMDFKNKVVVITGGSNGIGKALVEFFLSSGAKVATCSRNFDNLYKLQTENTGKPLNVYTADVSSESDCEQFIGKVIKNFGTIDILINNAGISMRSEFVDTKLETLKKLMDTNFWGAVYCTKHALPYLIKQKGVLVGISSIAGYRGLPGRCGYSASKHALNGWLESLRVELMDEGVHVMWVCPGYTTSNIRNVALNSKAEPEAESLLNEGKLMKAEETAQHIVNAIRKKKRTIVLTREGKEAVWINKFFPAWADRLMRKYYYNDSGELIK